MWCDLGALSGGLLREQARALSLLGKIGACLPEARDYLVTSITSLRNAWYRVSNSEKARIAYVLGKAYYQRGYYYADLALKYLDYAKKAGLKHDDLQEFRGLSAALIGDYETAIPAFTEALAINPSDLLLFTLAKSYQAAGNTDKALQYYDQKGLLVPESKDPFTGYRYCTADQLDRGVRIMMLCNLGFSSG